MKNKSIFRFISYGLLFATILIISACSSGSQNTNQNSNPQQSDNNSSSDDDVIRIGQILSLSGPVAVYGIPEKNGADMKIEELNEQGVEIGGKTYKVEVVNYDDGGQGNQTINLVRRLVEEDGINFITGGSMSDAVIAAAPTIESYNGDVIFMASAVSSDKVSKGHPHVFNLYYDSSKTGQKVAEWLVDERGFEDFAILREKIETSSIYADSFKEGVASKGKNLLAEEYFDTGDTNLTTQITNIISNDPEVVVVAAYADAGPLAIRQIRQQGFTGQIIVYGGTIPDAVEKGVLSKEDVEGIIEGDPVLVPQLVELGDERAIEFKEKYEEKFGEMGITAHMQYDGLQVLINAMKIAGTTTDVKAVTEVLRTATVEELNQDLIVENTPFEDGLFFGQDDHNVVQKSLTILEYKDGKPTISDNIGE